MAKPIFIFDVSALIGPDFITYKDQLERADFNAINLPIDDKPEQFKETITALLNNGHQIAIISDNPEDTKIQGFIANYVKFVMGMTENSAHKDAIRLFLPIVGNTQNTPLLQAKKWYKKPKNSGTNSSTDKDIDTIYICIEGEKAKKANEPGLQIIDFPAEHQSDYFGHYRELLAKYIDTQYFSFPNGAPASPTTATVQSAFSWGTFVSSFFTPTPKTSTDIATEHNTILTELNTLLISEQSDAGAYTDKQQTIPDFKLAKIIFIKELLNYSGYLPERLVLMAAKSYTLPKETGKDNNIEYTALEKVP